MTQISAIGPIRAGEPINPISPIKAKRQEQNNEQAMQMQPAFTAPIYMYPMQPMYVMPQPAMYMPQMMPMPQQYASNPIKQQEENQVTPREAMRAQALQPKITIENKADTKKAEAKTKPEDVIPNAEAKQVVKTPEKSIEISKANAQEETKNVAKKRPQIIEAETLKPQLDLDGLVDILKSDNYEDQANAMEAIAQVSKLAPEKADELLDVKVLDALTGIISQDTSKVPAADKKLAQRNKEYAMFTTAILQKQYINGVKDVAESQVPFDEIVGMSGIVNQLKTDDNASTREAALASLDYIKEPAYKNELKQLFGEATQDADATVRKRAEKELKSLK